MPQSTSGRRRSVASLLLVALFVLSVALPAAGMAAASGDAVEVEIDNCREINSADTWVLTQDIRNIGADACFQITASDVTLDLNGNLLGGSNTAGDAAIRVAAGVENVEIRNGNLFNWGDAVHVSGASDVTLASLTVEGTVGDGLNLTNTDGVTIEDVTMADTAGNAVNLSSATDVTVNSTNISNAGDGGIRAADTTGIAVDTVTVDDVDADSPGTGIQNPGIALAGASNVDLHDVTVLDAGMAIGVRSTTEVTVESTTIAGARIRGVDARDVHDFTLAGVTVDSSTEAGHLSGFEAVTVSNFTARGVSGGGLMFASGESLEITEYTATNVGEPPLTLAGVSNGTVDAMDADGGGGNAALVVGLSSSIDIANARLDANGDGVRVDRSDGVTVRDSTITASERGVVLTESPGSVARNLEVAGTTDIGVFVNRSNDVNLLDTSVAPKSESGVVVFASAGGTIRNVTTNGGAIGLGVSTAEEITIESVTLRGTAVGLALRQTTDVAVSGASISASEAWIRSSEDSENVVVTSLVLGSDVVSLRGDVFTISAADPPEPLSGQQVAGPALSVDSVGDTPLEVTLPYSDSGVAEGTVRLWRSADGWSALDSTRDADVNRVTGQVTSAGIVVALGEPADDTSPPADDEQTAGDDESTPTTATGSATAGGTTSTPDETTTPAPGFGAGVALVALVCALVVVAHRRQ